MSETPEATEQDLHCEPNTFSVNFAIYSGVGLFVIMVVGMLLMYAMFGALASEVEPPTPLSPAFVSAQPAPTEPELEPNLRAQMLEMRAAETQLLDSYRWIDREQGIAQIPIDRAMQILIEDGKLPIAGEAGANQGSEDAGDVQAETSSNAEPKPGDEPNNAGERPETGSAAEKQESPSEEESSEKTESNSGDENPTEPSEPDEPASEGEADAAAVTEPAGNPTSASEESDSGAETPSSTDETPPDSSGS